MSERPKLLTVEEIDACSRDGACLPDEWRAVLRAARAMALMQERGGDLREWSTGWSYQRRGERESLLLQCDLRPSPVEAIEDAEATR